MGNDFKDILEVIGYIAVMVVIGLVGIRIKEAIGWSLDIICIIGGWALLIWFLIKTN